MTAPSVEHQYVVTEEIPGAPRDLPTFRDPASVRLWLQADIRREPAERPLMTQAGHLAPDSSDLVLSLAPGRNL